ncbi:hypothetical protein OMVG_00148 [Ostreococcus lucimarinus virus OlV3]|nr:hypothetical protein OMVG_00148 [Ostreococcus lucimarinus virus OlV3]
MYNQRLKDLLNKGSVNHKKETVKCETLKDVHIYCKLESLPGQVSGSLIEDYIINNCNHLTKVKSSECKGDCRLNDRYNVEIKASLGGQTHQKFNYVQIRLGHNIDYYLFTAYYISNENVNSDGELYIFLIKKESMRNIIVDYGQYAHGTVSENGPICMENIKEDKEYALRVSYGSSLWKKLCEYRLTNSDFPNEFCRAVSSLNE